MIDEEELTEWKEQFIAASDICNLSKTNKVYFERFLDIYGNRLKGDSASFGKIMDARFEKTKIVYEEIMRRSDFEFKSASERLARKSLKGTRITLYVTVVAAIIAASSVLFAVLK
jgi:hypothetical protein